MKTLNTQTESIVEASGQKQQSAYTAGPSEQEGITQLKPWNPGGLEGLFQFLKGNNY